jgi:MFS family permease
VFAAGLIGLAAIVFGSYIANGGFYSDDWANVIRLEYDATGFWDAVNINRDILGARPLLAIGLVLPYELFGNDPTPHIALAVGLSVAMSLCFYLFLRMLGMEPVHAGALAVLVLLFPWSDSTRLWPAAGINNIAVCFYLLGATLALAGLQATGRRSWLLHAGAVLLYVLSILTYEVAAIATLLGIALYAYKAPWRMAVSRWLVDLAFVLPTLVWARHETREVRGVASWKQRLDDVPRFVDESFSLFIDALEPFGFPLWALLAGLIVFGAVRLGRGLRADTPRMRELRRWVLTAATALAAIAIAYVPILGSSLYPLKLGLENRANMFVALAIVVLIYSLCFVAGTLLLAGARRSRDFVLPFTLAASLLVGFGFLDRLNDDKRDWRDAAREQDRVLAAVEDALGTPKSGSTIYTFGHVGQVAPGVPVFSEAWDLLGAVQWKWDDPSLDAYPIVGETRFACGPSSMFPDRRNGGYVNSYYGQEHGDRYGQAYLVDVASGRVARPMNRSDCLETVPQFPVEPFYE